MKVSLVKKVVGVMLVLCAPFAVSGCSSDDEQAGNPDPSVTSGAPSGADEELSVSDVKLVKDKYGRNIVSATLTNNTDKQISDYGFRLKISHTGIVDEYGEASGELKDAGGEPVGLGCRFIDPGKTCDVRWAIIAVDGLSEEEMEEGEFFDPVLELVEVNYTSDEENLMRCSDQIEVTGLLDFVQSEDIETVTVKNNTGKYLEKVEIAWGVHDSSGELVPFSLTGKNFKGEEMDTTGVRVFTVDHMSPNEVVTDGADYEGYGRISVSLPKGSKVVVDATCWVDKSREG